METGKCRTIYFFGEINAATTARLTAELIDSARASSDPVILLINSDGGSVDDTIALYDVIQALPISVIGLVVGRAYSSALLLLQACEKRLMLPHSKIMIHEGTVVPGESSPAEAPRILKAELDGNATFNKLLAKSTRVPLTVINKMSKATTYMNSGEALKRGFADGIVKSLSCLDS